MFNELLCSVHVRAAAVSFFRYNWFIDEINCQWRVEHKLNGKAVEEVFTVIMAKNRAWDYLAN